MRFSDSISDAERKYLELLEEFFTRMWGETVLWSHDINHHRRVWQFAKELLTAISGFGVSYQHMSPEKLIIACYLHDIGMSADHGADHGKHSSHLCNKFLAENNLAESQFTEVLSAIEYHDNKKYPYSSSENQTLKILSASDDLDAFGFTGIYRYSEIYLARGISPEKIGILIRENAGSRFKNFKAAFGSFDELIEKHYRRFLILDDFFKEYNEQIPGKNNINKINGDITDVLKLLSEIIAREKTPVEISALKTKFSSDSLTDWYITGFLSELPGI